MVTLFYDCYRILTSVYSGGAFVKQAMSETPIDEKNRAHVTKICYGVLDKDVTLEYEISRLCDKRPKQAVRTILKIGMYSIKYLETAVYAVTDNLVELIKKLGKLEYIDENGTTKYCCGTKILPHPLVQEKPLPIKL